MDALVNELMKELNCDTVFTIPVLGGIPVKASRGFNRYMVECE